MPFKITRRAVFPLTAATALLQAQSRQSADVVIYGATPGGIGAAVAAARLGRSVILSEYADHIGGIVSNGLTNADIGKRQAVGGLFYEFTRRVLETYTAQDKANPALQNVKLCKDGYWYEASLAEKIFHDMIGGEGGRIKLLLSHELKRATVRSNRLTSICLEDRATPGAMVELTAAVFIDATYEGDLAAMAGVPFKTGRESRAEYNEPHAGRIYMKFRENTPLPGSTGEADEATQAYCFRMHVTNVPEKRIPIEKPASYNRDEYALTLEDIRAGRITKFREVIQVYAMPNGRFELNSDHVHPDTGIPRESLDLAEECWPWPTATPAQRQKIYQRYLDHNVGMIWLLQNDSEVPEALRKDASQYGWHRDEWVNNRNRPRQVYVRQGRRILGEYVLTENDGTVDPELKRTKVQPTSIGVIEWAFDPHGHHKYDPAHPGVREGYFFVDHEPFQVPYGVVVPRKIDGLLVPVACSCSHVAYNALRMEPVFIVLGEACGVAAHLSIEHKVPVRRVPTRRLQAILAERRGVLTFYEDLPFTDADFPALQWLGARGLNAGYRAEKTQKLTRGDGAAQLARVLQHEGRKAAGPAEGADLPLTAEVLAGWLKTAGYAAGNEPDGPLDVAGFGRMVYAALRPKM
ncbi:FAD-dependent oxidoreductase [Paludibaculum fermentans]|uniref:FAD-dependent oxidoreductase n=1 Tax=Paludibaculum fermentans TaxID=1473598 RepID=UPI003EB983F1